MESIGSTPQPEGERHDWIVCPTPVDDFSREVCWFCGALLKGSVARRACEHVFARWLLREFDAHRHSFHLTWTDSLERNVLDQRSMVLDAYVAGRVCGSCNHGWMSQLEGDAREDVSKLGRGLRTIEELDVASLGVLARWAAKTAFASQSVALGPKLVPEAHRRALCEGDLGSLRIVGRVSPVDLGLSTYGTQRWRITYPPRARTEVVDAVARSYKVVLTAGRLVLAVCSWPEPAWPMAISRASHVAIWPADASWLSYGYATDRHGVAPDAVTEMVDMVVGTIVAHPASASRYSPAG
jgi:alkylhydroperoxidase family enzyme